MRLFIALAGLGLIAAAPALACDSHAVHAAAPAPDLAAAGSQAPSTPVTDEQRAAQLRAITGMQAAAEAKPPVSE